MELLFIILLVPLIFIIKGFVKLIKHIRDEKKYKENKKNQPPIMDKCALCGGDVKIIRGKTIGKLYETQKYKVDYGAYEDTRTLTLPTREGCKCINKIECSNCGFCCLETVATRETNDFSIEKKTYSIDDKSNFTEEELEQAEKAIAKYNNLKQTTKFDY